MSRIFAYLTGESIDDELNVLRGYSFNGFLDDMIAVLVLDALHHIVFQFLDKLSLLIGKYMFKGLISVSETAVFLH